MLFLSDSPISDFPTTVSLTNGEFCEFTNPIYADRNGRNVKHGILDIQIRQSRKIANIYDSWPKCWTKYAKIRQSRKIANIYDSWPKC